MEKGFNGLACRTDAEMGTVAGTQDVIALSFSWRNDLNLPAFLQRICPIRITISPVSEQVAKRNRSAVSIDLFCSRQIRAGRRRNLCGPEKREPRHGASRHKYMCVNKFSGLATPRKRVFGPARKSGSLLVSIRIALLEGVKCPLANRKSTVTLHTAAACSCRPKTFSCGEHRLQTPGSGSNVFRSRHSSYNLSAKKSLPQTLNLHL